MEDASWYIELDKFLDGKENNLKNHPKYLNNFRYEFLDKSFPTQEQARDLISKV